MGTMKDAKFKPPAEFTFATALRPFFPWLAMLMTGPVYLGDVSVRGVSVKLQENGWLAVVTGMDTAQFQNVVCFGSGGNPFAALVAVTKNMKRGRWGRDKFVRFLPG